MARAFFFFNGDAIIDAMLIAMGYYCRRVLAGRLLTEDESEY